jgi:hypothetical protein
LQSKLPTNYFKDFLLESKESFEFYSRNTTQVMTLQETQEKILSLQHLIGQKVPKWETAILEMIPAPINDSFPKYIDMYEQDGNVDKALLMTKSNRFDILLIFSKPNIGSFLVYEWYGFFYKS